jgi:epsilon-lactone hydrolase
MNEIETKLYIPAREIPMPSGISNAAKAILATKRPPIPPYPPVEDKEAWRRLGAGINQAMLPAMQARANGVEAEVAHLDVGGVRVYEIRPRGVEADDPRIILDIHGVAYFVGFGEACRAQAIGVAGDLHRQVWSVDYRSPPDYPYPAPLNDCLTVYKALLEKAGAENIIVGGASAGANLTAALILRAR